MEGRFGWFLSVIRPNGILVYMDTAVRAGSCVGNAAGMGAAVRTGSCVDSAVGMDTAVRAGSCAGNAAGMGAVRLLQVKRCGRLGQRAVLALACCPDSV